MQRNRLKSLGSPLGGAVLGLGFFAQEPPRRPLGIPMWVWILLFVLVIIVAIIWVLREDEQKAAQKEEKPGAAPEPELAPVEAVAPAAAVAAAEEEAAVVEEAAPVEAEVEAATRAAGMVEVAEEAVVEEAAPVGAVAVAAAAATAAMDEEEAVVEEAALVEAEVEPAIPVGEVAPAAAGVAIAAGEAVEAAAAGPDDLTRIEGIGPKIAGVLQAAGITSYGQLAETDVGRLQAIMDQAGIGRIADPSTWPEQAGLAAAGNWAALEALQDRLKGGRKVRPDNFQRIEGIGPKIARVLQAAGITSFAQLADTGVDRLRQILDEAGITRISDPSTWPEQARLAADDDWAGLERLQSQLKGGRRTGS